MRRKRKFAVVLVAGVIVAGIWFYSEPVLLVIATTYLLSGVYLKLSQAFHRSRVETPVRAEGRNI